MTCAAPKDKGRMRSPDGEAAEWVNRRGGCLKKVGGFGVWLWGKRAEREHTGAPECM